jgi:type II restriction/modification system DNA methylase subunit YeeA
MNTGNIKQYAPKARTRFIETMTRQAARYGITPGEQGEGHAAPMEIRGDVMLITTQDGQTHSFPKALRGPREALARWVTQLGFDQAIEQAAYSWFNRLCAIRFMELKGYLDHGRRVLSHPDHESGLQILDDCLEIELPGLAPARVRELKLDGTQDETLYRELLLAQCNALHSAMPFLFEPLDDASELLLPDSLTKTDSLIRELVTAIPEEDWQDVEVIGWLYQFYIAEKKDQVIGKVVKSEDIPAATQLFTPNWIVQYLVQNSVGRQWLQTYPDSPLKGQMPYYIEPAEQEPEVQAQLDAITPASIDPETIKVLDPACGSGHILVEAYNVLKAIYEERGYRSRDIPKLILENNLFGLDIDDRAAQLAGFALLMKAREDDRRIFTRGIRMNVMALQSTQHLDASTLWRDLNLTGDWHQGQSQSLFESEQKELSSNDNTYKAIVDLIERFQDAKTFGSLIEVPDSFEATLKSLLDELSELRDSGDTMQKAAARQLIPIVQQAWVLAHRYEAVVANPPYMGRRNGMNSSLKNYIQERFDHCKADLYAAFIQKGIDQCGSGSHMSMVAMQSWMFLSSYKGIRVSVLDNSCIDSLLHLGSRAFPEISGEVVQTAAFSCKKSFFPDFKPSFKRLVGVLDKGNTKTIKSNSLSYSKMSHSDILEMPDCTLAYWLPPELVDKLTSGDSLESYSDQRQGLATGDDDSFIRYWHEISYSKINWDPEDFPSDGKPWFLFLKGGTYRRWYGNNEHCILFSSDAYQKLANQGNKLPSKAFYLIDSLTWSDITSCSFAARYNPPGKIFATGALSAFPKDKKLYNYILAFMNSKVNTEVMSALSSGIHYSVGYVDKSPLVIYEKIKERVSLLASKAIEISKNDWDGSELSWDFNNPGIIEKSFQCELVKDSLTLVVSESERESLKLNEIEKEINDLFIDSYGLHYRYSSDIALKDTTINKNLSYRYAENIDKNILVNRYKSDLLAEIISYSVGCIMGRYSLDRPGLILASQGETVRDYLAQIPEPSFAPDENAIIPLTDQEWFPDDATNRFRDFVRTVWGEDHLQENLDFVAESLCLHAITLKKGEAALDTIRRYMSTQFFKDHLRTYKKRPIYWLFSSGKQKAFECLVYLHRYNESTLAEMRTDYVIPLTTKLAGYVEKLEQDKENSTSAADAKRIEKDLSRLHKQQAELNAFDEKLRHYADQRISLDLDDGVKVNYGKFGDLLAEVKDVTGVKPT